jgi:hypothetical protein
VIEWPKQILDFLKLRLPVLIALSIALGLFIFSPDATAKRMGFLDIRTKYKAYASLAFLLTVSLMTVQIVTHVSTLISKRRKAAKFKKEMYEHLQRLSPEEKQVLCAYLLQNTKTQYFSPQDGIISGLVSRHILYRSSNVGNLYGRGFAFNIQQWVWDYLITHRELILEGVPRDELGQVMIYTNPDNLFGD